MADNGDAELLSRFLADRSAANRDALMACWVSYAESLARGFLHKRRIHEPDAIREVALKYLWRAIECHDPNRKGKNKRKASLKSYIHTRVKMGAAIYKPQRQPKDEHELDPCMSTNGGSAARDARESIAAILTKLDVRHAQALRWRFIEGLTFQQIGDRLDVCVDRARELVNAALAEARRVQRRAGPD